MARPTAWGPVHDLGSGAARQLTVISGLLAAGVIAGLIGIGVVVAWPTSPPNGLSGLSAVQIRAVAIESALGHGTVHIVVTGAAQTTLDVAASSGVQVISEGGHQVAQIAVQHSTAYLNASATFLAQSVGLAQSVATSYANRWISFERSDGNLFQAVAGGVTLSSALDQTLPGGPLSVTPERTVNGQSVVGIVGKMRVPGSNPFTATVTAYVSSAAPHDVVKVVTVAVSSHATRTETVSFSDWGEPLEVEAPAGAVAYSSIGSGH
jgi:hypothetical protein